MEKKRRINAAIEETRAALRKEMSYTPVHQNKDLIRFYLNHISTLTTMLEEIK